MWNCFRVLVERLEDSEGDAELHMEIAMSGGLTRHRFLCIGPSVVDQCSDPSGMLPKLKHFPD